MTPTPSDRRSPTLRAQRLKLAWGLALPFLIFVRPTPKSLLLGGLISTMGLILRGVAAGSIDKERDLAQSGLYGHVRHPLYLGSFLVGTGLATAGGVWWILPVFIGLFLWMYGRTIVAEERGLSSRFGSRYREYRERVPAFLPRISRRPDPFPGPGFRARLYWRNKEWQAAAGVATGFMLLGAKMLLLS
jgi:hypothetical protein